jgi:hypothetical protein
MAGKHWGTNKEKRRKKKDFYKVYIKGKWRRPGNYTWQKAKPIDHDRKSDN